MDMSNQPMEDNTTQRHKSIESKSGLTATINGAIVVIKLMKGGTTAEHVQAKTVRIYDDCYCMLTLNAPSNSEGDKIHIKVHDPMACKCVYKITSTTEPVIALPSRSGHEAQKASLFNSVYFQRIDGVRRNALGEKIEIGEGSNAREGRVTKRTLGQILRIRNPEALDTVKPDEMVDVVKEIMSWDAEIMNYQK